MIAFTLSNRPSIWYFNSPHHNEILESILNDWFWFRLCQNAKNTNTGGNNKPIIALIKPKSGG